MVFYTLGVTRAKPGYTRARIAPRLGSLDWAKGQVPTPYGLMEVQVAGEKVVANSPVPLLLDLEDKSAQEFQAGRQEIAY
jgi:alpha-L-rhamnosidase